jgi:hypothetical protein
MYIKRIKSPLDLKGLHNIKKINFIRIPLGRKVFVKKHGDHVSLVTPNNHNLSKRVNEMINEIKKVNFDFLAEAVLTSKNKLMIVDILSADKRPLHKSHAKRIIMMNQLFDCENIIRPEVTCLEKFTDVLTGQYRVIVDTDVKVSMYLYESDASIRNVIIGDYYYGNKVDNERELLFKCYQTSKQKSMYMGKIRIENLVDRKKARNILNKQKRLIAQVRVSFDKRNSKKFSKLSFVRFLSDEKFKDIVIDDELFFSPIQIFSIGPKSSKFYYLVEENKNLNTLTGAI